MSDDTKIEPALSAEEWRHNCAFVPRESCDMFIAANSLLLGHGKDSIGYVIDADDAPTAIAMLNHALPDGHPLKLTRADVDSLLDAAMSIEAEFGTGTANDLRALAAKIEALLPPPA